MVLARACRVDLHWPSVDMILPRLYKRGQAAFISPYAGPSYPVRPAPWPAPVPSCPVRPADPVPSLDRAAMDIGRDLLPDRDAGSFSDVDFATALSKCGR